MSDKSTEVASVWCNPDYKVVRYHRDGRSRVVKSEVQDIELMSDPDWSDTPWPRTEPSSVPVPSTPADVKALTTDMEFIRTTLDAHAAQIEALTKTNNELVASNSDLNELVAELMVKIEAVSPTSRSKSK